MKDAQKPDHASLNTIIMRLKEGRYVVPDFQREFEWNPWDIRELFRSIFLDYYIGSLLLWKGKKENFDALSCEPIYGFNGKNNSEFIVLDGQQRLTAIYYGFVAPEIPLPKKKKQAVYFMRVDKFMEEQFDEAFHYDWLSKRMKKVLDNPDTQFEEHIFPFSTIGAGGWSLPNWVQGYEQYWHRISSEAENNEDTARAELAKENAANAKSFGEHLKGITEQYQISYIELDQDLEVDKVCDIFTQINSRGIQLDVFDLINALLKPKGLQLKKMWREASPKLDFVNTGRMNVYILQVMSILCQAYCSPKYLYYLLPGQEKQVREQDGTRKKEILVPDLKTFEELWNKAVQALQDAIKILRHPQEFGSIKSEYLPYVSILPVFSSLQAHIKSLPAIKRLEAQRKVRHWYWASVFTNRYSGSVESTSARDFLDIKTWLDDDMSEPSLLQEFKNRFKNLELRKETKRGTSVYNGIFNLLVLKGARDWMTGNIPQHDDLDDHHIVPKSWDEKPNGNLIDTILNRTPLTADTNRHVISDRLPNEYLPQLIKDNGEKAVKAILESHFISPLALEILLRDPFTPDDFEAFITERQKTFQDAIENLLIKERLDLTPALRELDETTEQVELGLRKIIIERLDSDANLLPSHVQQKINEKFSKAVKKNPALDSDFYQSLAGQFEFCDLRELQDIITGKSCWNLFQETFGNKESLNTKFGQLADLRNAIRHSRTVDDVTKKEGEASLIWFKQILNLK